MLADAVQDRIVGIAFELHARTGGVGNTWKDPEAFATLFRDVNEKIFDALPDETWVYSGHGGDTTLGTERPHLAEWRERGW